jgi:hypothetical protein
VGGQLCGCKHLLQVLLDAVRNYPPTPRDGVNGVQDVLCRRIFRGYAVCAIAYCLGEFARGPV